MSFWKPWLAGRIAGIPILVHPALVGLLVLLLLTSGGGFFATLVFVLALAFSVLVHELAHALAARLFGWRADSILLHPLGGLASLTPPGPPLPREELCVALAGPAASLLLGALGLEVGDVFRPARIFGAINLGLGLFNLLPAWPLDGGVALRCLLQLYGHGATRTDQITLRSTQVVCLGMMIVAVVGLQLPLLIIAVGAWLTAHQKLGASSDPLHVVLAPYLRRLGPRWAGARRHLAFALDRAQWRARRGWFAMRRQFARLGP